MFWLSQPGIRDDLAQADAAVADGSAITGAELRAELGLPGLPNRSTCGGLQQHDISRTASRLVIRELVTVTPPANPLRLTKPLAGELDGVRSARPGDHRVLVGERS